MAAFDFPSSPTVGQTYTLNGVTYKWDGVAWTGGPVADVSAYVLKGGDTMTGTLTVSVPANANASLFLSKTTTTGYAAYVEGQKGGVPRWQVLLGDGTAESGGNTGSHFGIQRLNDAGAYIETPFFIDRTTGVATFSQILSSRAYQCKPGISGAYIANSFNINWTTGAQLWIDNTNVGTISVTSDYRVKKGIKPLGSMWEKVRNLRPISFHWKPFSVFKNVDPALQYGFVAHEIQEDIIPSAASGKKDAENEIQSLNLPAIVAALTKALQEAMDRIEALEAR